jgi:hypothetical protein
MKSLPNVMRIQVEKNAGVVKWQITCCYERMSVNKPFLKCGAQMNMLDYLCPENLYPKTKVVNSRKYY